MARLAFIEKTLAKGIDRDPVGVTVAIRFVADFHIRKRGIDRSRVGALPMAGCLCAELNGHHEYLAGVMLATAHFHQIGVRTEIPRAFFRAGLKAPGTVASDGVARSPCQLPAVFAPSSMAIMSTSPVSCLLPRTFIKSALEPRYRARFSVLA